MKIRERVVLILEDAECRCGGSMRRLEPKMIEDTADKLIAAIRDDFHLCGEDNELVRTIDAETKLHKIRKYVMANLGMSQMMKPVSLVLRRVLAILDGEDPDQVN